MKTILAALLMTGIGFAQKTTNCNVDDHSVNCTTRPSHTDQVASRINKEFPLTLTVTGVDHTASQYADESGGQVGNLESHHSKHIIVHYIYATDSDGIDYDLTPNWRDANAMLLPGAYLAR